MRLKLFFEKYQKYLKKAFKEIYSNLKSIFIEAIIDYLNSGYAKTN